MKNFLLLGLILITITSYGQRPSYSRKPSITGKVSGVLVDSASNEKLPYAAIVVKDPRTEKDVNGTITEADGSFKFPAIPIGQYNLVISFVGYAPISKSFTLTAKKPDFDFGSIALVATSKQLDEVVVKGERDLIENRIDKIVYNAEDDVANQGGDASDVLRRAPLLNVDLDGNVSLRGSSNVNILINGKPSSMFSANPGDALKSIPSDQIKSVEVITSPGAKYDGEGSAGIINIITKKSVPDGLAGSVDLTAGNRQTRGVLSLNGGTGRLGFNASGSSFYSWPQRSTTDVFRENIRDGQSIVFTDNGELDSKFLGYFANAGMFYDFNAFNSISTSFRLRAFDRGNDGTYVTTLDDPTTDPATMLNYTRDQISDTKNSGYEWSVDYIKKFEGQDGRELSFSYKLDGNVSDQNNEVLQMDLAPEADPELFRDEINFNDGDNKENTLQTDYVHPMGDKSKLEAGAKVVLRDVVSEFTYLERDMGDEDYVIDFNRTNSFFYDQNVFAGYLSTNFPISETMAVLAGVRYERTSISGSLLENEGAFSNEYDNLLPNITISKNISQSDIIKLSYNKRIQRPGLRQINPYVNLNNTFNISFGNPFLEPEITQQLDLNYSAFIKKVTINTSIFYKRVTDVIESITTINDENVSETTFQNIGLRNELGMNIFVSTKLFDIWTIRGGVNFSGFEATGTVGEDELTRNAFLINGNINSNLKLKKNWIIDVFGFYRAPQQTVQGFVPSFSLMVMGVRKTFWDEKASIGIRIVEPFFENKTFKSEIEGPDYIQTSEFVRPFRSVGISLRYRFGKLDYSNRQRRSKINNSDVKSGGDAQNSQF